MKLTYSGGAARLRLPDGQEVERGATVDVSAQLGEQLARRPDFRSTEDRQEEARQEDHQHDEEARQEDHQHDEKDG